ncbi:MAG TPA: anti-sigma factor [Acidimicrobiales bacterium]|nr:anti-sigma factor [Acidimicrobiales bacterium]
MIHEEIEELLGAYALDATSPQEREQVEAHLAECPRCRDEVAAHLEVAGMLGSASSEAPAGLWEKVASAIAEEHPGEDRARATIPPPAGVVALAQARRARPKRGPREVLWAGIAAVAAAVVALLGADVAHLNSQVRQLRGEVAKGGLQAGLAELEAAPHATVQLASADRRLAAIVVVSPSGQAYWTWSSLSNLPSSQTYQLWGLSRGKPVSLALVGARPDAVDYFTVERGITALLVTAEPEGGTTGPTTAVLASGAVPASFVS